jgi:hypothetical protein
VSRRPLGIPVQRWGDVERVMWSESPIPRVATRRVRGRPVTGSTVCYPATDYGALYIEWIDVLPAATPSSFTLSAVVETVGADNGTTLDLYLTTSNFDGWYPITASGGPWGVGDTITFGPATPSGWAQYAALDLGFGWNFNTARICIP